MVKLAATFALIVACLCIEVECFSWSAPFLQYRAASAKTRTATRLPLQLRISLNAVSVQPLNEKLWQASADGEVELIRHLIEQGASVNAQQPYSEEPLPQDSERQEYPGFTALHMAAMMNQVAAINMLVDAGADVNAKTEALTTPLHIAAVHGRVNAVQALVDLGADVHAKNEFGSDPLKMAKLSMGRHKGTIALLEHLTNTPHEPWADTAITGC